MKKSLIAVAVAGLFAAPVAMAEVTLSGAINLGIELSKSSGGVGGTSLTKTQLNSNYSHVDLESVDDIGGGNKIIFHYQLFAQPQNVTGVNDANRNSFLGVAGDWGAFKMGSNENVYERFMYTADPIDGAVGPGGNLMILGTPGANTAFDVGQAGGGAGFELVVTSTPVFTTGADASFTVGIGGSFSVATTPGNPTATVLTASELPEGLDFTDNGDGTGIITGAPAIGTAGSHPITVTASNGVGAGTQISGTIEISAAETVALPPTGRTFAKMPPKQFGDTWLPVIELRKG